MKGYYVLKLVCQAGVSLMVLSCVMNEASQTSLGVQARKPLGSRHPPGSPPSTEDDYFEESFDNPQDDQYANYNDERRDGRSTQRSERGRNREQDFEDYPGEGDEDTENFDETYLGQN